MDILAKLNSLVNRAHPTLGAQLTWQRERRTDIALRLVDGFVRSGDVVVDIGANWGLFAARLSRLVGATGHVHAIEPDPVASRRLAALMRRQPNVTTYSLALTDHDGEVQLFVPVIDGRRVSALASVNPHAVAGAGAIEQASVRSARLDTLLPAGGPPVAFIKCDVEGHEPAVLRGARLLLECSSPTLLIEIEQRHQRSSIEETFRYLATLGYDGYAVLATEGIRPIADFDVQRDQLAWLNHGTLPADVPDRYVSDFLFVRAGTDVTRWLARGA